MSTTDVQSIKDQSNQPEPQPAPPPPESASPAKTLEPADDLRRVDDYRRRAHRQGNLLIATLGQSTANLMEIEARISGVVRQSMAEGELSMDDLEAYTPAIDQIIRLDKQATQMSQLQMQLMKSDSIGLPKPTW